MKAEGRGVGRRRRGRGKVGSERNSDFGTALLLLLLRTSAKGIDGRPMRGRAVSIGIIDIMHRRRAGRKAGV